MDRHQQSWLIRIVAFIIKKIMHKKEQEMSVTRHYLKRKKKESTPKCSVCLSRNIQILIDFGLQPNTFDMLKEPTPNPYLHNLTLSYCMDCGFVFQETPIQAELIYNNYMWPSSAYPAEHLAWLSSEIVNQLTQGPDDLVLDVGCNDGYFLNMVVNLGHTKVLGIEPAKDCAKIAAKRGIEIINDYLSTENALDIRSKYGFPRVIICRHVMEHIQNVDLFIESIKSLMDDRTTLALELPNFDIIASNGDFCSIWEQHVNFFSTKTINKLLKRHHLAIMSEYVLPFAGGSMLHYIVRGDIGNNPGNDVGLALKFRDIVEKNILQTQKTIQGLCDAGRRVIAYGAGSRGSCFINLAGIGTLLSYVIDDNEQKIGLYMPGSNLPIVGPDRLYKDIPGYCIVVFNSKSNEVSVMERHRRYVELGGRFVEVLPGNFMNAPILGKVD